MKRKPVGVDIIMALGGGKHKPSSSQDDEGSNDPFDSSEPDDNGLPPDFEAAWQDYHDHPSAQSFWDAVEACSSAPKSKSKDDSGY